MRDGRPHSDTRATVTVVGAGLSGMACARALSARYKVKLFDKSRGVGGRLSTRYAEAYEFDHGAQYFTVRNPGFADAVLRARRDGVLAQWQGRALYLTDDTMDEDRGGTRWVGTPRMNSFAKWMASDTSGAGALDIELGARVSRLESAGGWTLHFEDGDTRAGFDAVVLAVPAPQAMALLPDDSPHRAQVSRVEMDPCFALMVGLDGAHDFGLTTLRAKGLPVDWLAVNSTKPGRPDAPTTLMIHREAEWSCTHVDTDRAEVERILLQTASDLLRHDFTQAPHTALHRWLYSSVRTPVGEPALWDEDARLGVCGDWCPGGRVEGAWLSGTALAGMMS